MLKIPKENNDQEPSNKEEKSVLEVYLHFNVPEDYSFEEHGGQIVYMDLSEDHDDEDNEEIEKDEEEVSHDNNEDQTDEQDAQSSKQHTDELMTIVPKNNCL